MIRAFFLGMWEFRRSFTRSFDYPYRDAFDRGREFAHIITFRRYES